jgi:hypothetical protein
MLALLRIALCLMVCVTVLGTPARAQDWTPLASPSPATGNTSQPRLAADASGVTTAIWSQSNAGSFQTFASRLTNGVWSAPATLSSVDSQSADVVVDGTGVVTAIWYRFAPGSMQIMASRYVGGAWSVPVALSAAAPQVITARAVVDSAGIVTVAWASGTGGSAYDTQAVRFVDGAWTAPHTFTPPGANSRPGLLAVDSAGIVTAVWTRFTGGGRLEASRYVSGAWTPAVLISRAGFSAFGYAIVAHSGGDVTVAWTEVNNGSGLQNRVEAVRYTGGAWSTPVTIAPGTSGPGQIELVVEPAGDVVAFWTRDDDPSSYLLTSRMSSGVWTAPQALAMPNPNSFDVVGRPNGEIVAVASSYGTDGRIRAMTYSAGTWSAPVALSEPNHTAYFPMVVATNGGVVAAWSSNAGVGAAQIAAPAPIEVPTLTEWAMLLLLAGLAWAGWTAIRRRFAAQ